MGRALGRSRRSRGLSASSPSGGVGIYPGLCLGIVVAVLVVAAGCGGGGRAAEPETGPEQATSVPDLTPLEQALALLPDVEALRAQVLFGDLALLRERYASPSALREALAGVWLPDALAGATGPGWRRSFGFGLGAIERFVAGGFHPEEAAVLLGEFDAAAIRAQLGAGGYARAAGLLSRGDDGEIDPATPVGRLALASLNRVAVRGRRLVASSTSELARAVLAARGQSLPAGDADLALAARAVGGATAAVVLPSEFVRPPTGVLVAPLVLGNASLVAVGLDDRGPRERVVTIVLVYGNEAEARDDASTLAEHLAGTALPVRSGVTFGELLERLAVRIEGGRAVVVTGTITAGESPGLWRGLLESGDLAVLVRPG